VNEVDTSIYLRPMPKRNPPPDLQAWIDARKRHRLSHAQVQMARELGLNPKKLGKIDNHEQERWKAPLPRFIEELYRRRFKRDAPLRVVPLEERARHIEQAQAARRERKAARREARAAEPRKLPPGPGEEAP
jgi:hypothetical protein